MFRKKVVLKLPITKTPLLLDEGMRRFESKVKVRTNLRERSIVRILEEADEIIEEMTYIENVNNSLRWN